MSNIYNIDNNTNCILGQLQVAFHKIQNEKEFSRLVYRARSYRTLREIRKHHGKRH